MSESFEPEISGDAASVTISLSVPQTRPQRSRKSGNSSVARLTTVLPRCMRMIALGAMGRLFWPSLFKKDRRNE